MSIVNIKFRDNSYTLACNDATRMLEVSNKFSARAEKLAANLNNVTDGKLAIITGIMLEDEILRLTEEKRETPKGISEADAAIAMSKTLDQISEYIEELAHKLEIS